MTDLPPIPAQLEPFVRVLGPDDAVTFLMTFGGAEMYFAKNPKGRSRLAQVLGIEKAEALAAEAENNPLMPRRIPLGKAWIAQLHHQRGLPVAEIARRLHTTDVTVRKYLAAATGRAPSEDPRQARLF